MNAADLPADVSDMLAKVYRALYGATPTVDDLNEYLTDPRAFVEDLAAYSVECQRGRVEDADLLEDADFVAISHLLEIRNVEVSR